MANRRRKVVRTAVAVEKVRLDRKWVGVRVVLEELFLAKYLGHCGNRWPWGLAEEAD